MSFIVSLLLTNIYARHRILICINMLKVSFHVIHYFPIEKSVHLIHIVVPLDAIHLFPPSCYLRHYLSLILICGLIMLSLNVLS